MNANRNAAPDKAGDREGPRLIPREMPATMQERIAFNLSDEFGANFVEANQRFAKAVYAEAYAAGAALTTGNETPSAARSEGVPGLGWPPPVSPTPDSPAPAPSGAEREAYLCEVERLIRVAMQQEMINGDVNRVENRAAFAQQTARKIAALRPAPTGSGEPDSRAGVEQMEAALEFYADPDTYCAIGFFPDRPCGEFMDDFSDEHDPGYPKPGKRARAALAALQSAPIASAAAGPVVDVAPMRLSGGRTDYYVRLSCGGRTQPPHVFRERFKAEYEVAHLQWVLGLRPDEPDLMAYDEASYPNDATPTPDPHPVPAMEGRS